MSLTIPRTLALALALIPAAAPAPAQDPKPPAVQPGAKPADPKAQALLERVAQAYKGLSSYADDGKFVVSMTTGDEPHEETAPVRLAFVRPNKISLDVGPVHLLSDGRTMTTIVHPLKKYMTAPAPAAIDIETFHAGPVRAAVFGGPAGMPMYILINLLTADEPVKAIEELGGSLQLAADDPTGQTILIDQTDGPDVRLSIDPATKLLTAIDLIVDPKTLEASAREGHPIKIAKLGWSAGVVSAPSFAFDPPADFAKVDSVAELDEEDDQQSFAVEALVGQPAPDFNLTLLKGPGETRTVSKADLAGKVVVIAFWATEAGPSIKELFEIQKVVDKMSVTTVELGVENLEDIVGVTDEPKKGKENVRIVALSEDSEPAELAELRKLVEKTLEKWELKLLDRAVADVGLDPSNTVGEKFQLEILPTLVVLDGEGVVRSAHVGFSPDLREKLIAEIDALIAGEPLPGAEAGDK